MDYVVLGKVLVKEPLNCGVAFSCHVGYNCCLVKALINIDHTVEEINLNACLLSLGENFVPTGGLSC